MAHILIHKVKCQIRMDRQHSGKILLHSPLLGSDSFKSALLQSLSNNTAKISLRLNTLELNLGAISVAQFDTQFNQRLAQAFAQCLSREHAFIRGPKEMDIQFPDIAVLQDRLHECNPGETEVFQWAQGCLQPATLKSLIQDSPANQLQRMLKLLLEGEYPPPQILPVFWYDRVTASRLSIAAVLYLLKSQRGHNWLMHHHSPTVSQVTDWAKAIAQGEIPPEQVVQLLTGNQPFDSISPEQQACPSLVVMCWLLPLWRQPAVRKVIHRLKGRQGVHRLDAYLSRCLQRQDDVMQEEKGMQSVPEQVVLPQDNTVLSPDRGGESDAQQVAPQWDVTTLPESEETSRRTIPPTKGGLRLPNVPRLSSQEISNAGLLLLWPLFPQLFSQLGLWEQEQFVSDAAQWQAVYVLERLVWGETNSSEERLTLNQVLCGVSCSTSVPSLTPLSLLQLQQIDGWLTAIGQQLAGWQKLSLTDIRQLFLQRTGEISTEGAVPQINVWPEPYDFLLRDWPWPMTLASFPWTEQPLTIVWPLNGFTG
ncbi:contractile injection system tape measure protein [Salmonella enterica]